MRKILILIIVLSGIFVFGLSSDRRIGRASLSMSETGRGSIGEIQGNLAVGDIEYFEDYVLHSLCAEMPSGFNIEALKAQAVAIRTYAYRELCHNPACDLKRIGQAYIDDNALKKNWGENYEVNLKKLRGAVEATRGEIMLYNEEPIFAAFCSCNGGVSEEAQNVWNNSVPYLKSVKSELDEKAPVYLTEYNFSYAEVEQALKSNGIKAENGKIWVTKRSEAGYATEVLAGNQRIKGTLLRTILKLKSSNIEVENSAEGVKIISRGYGHGVGMSQYGANFLAEEGHSYLYILNKYYQGIEIGKIY